MGRHADRTAATADRAGDPTRVDGTERAAAHVSMPWTRTLVASAARAVLFAVVGLALWGAAPSLIGWQTTTVMTGSMEPRIAPGDVVAAAPVDPASVVPGRIVLFDDPDHAGRLRLHRVIDTDPAGRLVTQGDANPQADSTPVDPSTVRGVAVLRVPGVGLPVLWLREGRWTELGLLVLFLLGLAALGRLDRGLFGDPDRRAGDDTGSGTSDEPGDPTEPTEPTDDDTAATGSPDPAPTAPRAPRLPGPRHAAVPVGVAPLALLRRFAAVLVLAALTVTAAAAGTSSAAYRGAAANSTSTLSAAQYYTCAAAQLADAPSLLWKFDETSQAVNATAADSSGKGSAGTYRLGATPTTGSVCDGGRAATFNGSTQYVVQSATKAVAGPNTFTVEAWFRTSTTRGGKIIGFGNSQLNLSTQYDRHLYLTNSGTVVFGVYPNAVRTIASTRAYNDNAWHHVAATLSGAGAALYVDGALVASDPTTTSGEAYSGWWKVGGDELNAWTDTPTSDYFAGSIDNAAVYPTALSASAIAAHAAATRP